MTSLTVEESKNTWCWGCAQYYSTGTHASGTHTKGEVFPTYVIPNTLSWGVYDIETKKWAQDVGGWSKLRNGEVDWKELGLSCIAIWDSISRETDIYDKHDLASAIDLLESLDVVCDFNGERFDKPVLDDIFGRPVAFNEHFDLLRYIWKASNASKGGNTLDAVAQATLGRGKTGDGEKAILLEREHRYAELHRYCMNDVRLTRDLIIHVRSGNIITNGKGIELMVEVPEWFRL